MHDNMNSALSHSGQTGVTISERSSDSVRGHFVQGCFQRHSSVVKHSTRGSEESAMLAEIAPTLHFPLRTPWFLCLLRSFSLDGLWMGMLSTSTIGHYTNVGAYSWNPELSDGSWELDGMELRKRCRGGEGETGGGTHTHTEHDGETKTWISVLMYIKN
jgi:hypothetical protein